MATPAIELSHVSKRYRHHASGRDRLVEALSFGRVDRGQDHWALRDVSFAVEPGTSLGILGRNGAGKSTLLSIVSGVLRPTSGRASVDGRLVALLQLGAGFKLDYTGRENVMLNGLLLGLTREEVIRKFDEIEAFADIGEFMDRPVRTYSSGMRARLGFAVAVHVEPDVLLIDETLSVGDAVFRHLGMQKMRELREGGATILFVSHGLDMVRNFCNEAVLLHEGRLLSHGGTGETIDRYEALVSEIEARRKAEETYGPPEEEEVALLAAEPGVFEEDAESPKDPLRHGTGGARVEKVEILDGRGRPVEEATPEDPLRIRVRLRYAESVPASSMRVTLRNKAGLDVFSTSTNLEKTPIGPRGEGERVVVDFVLDHVTLRHGSYGVTVVVSDDKNLYLDWANVAAIFRVARPRSSAPYRGVVHLPTTVEVRGPDRAGSPNLQ